MVKANFSVTNLATFLRKRFYHAGDGGHGQGKRRRGERGENLVLEVPVGTMVWRKTQLGQVDLIADLVVPGQKIVVAKGGKGGWGNTHFASSIHQTPQIAQKGEAGEENFVILELRLVVDVVIIGYPNVGKSSLLRAVSAAKPEINSYPFTTRQPVLGVAEVGHQSFVLAEIPGLVDGAHLGRGLGYDFLRHAMRAKIVIHLLDGESASPVEDMIRVNTELRLFDLALSQKPQLVVVNKIDLPPVRARLAEVKAALAAFNYNPFFISAATGEGVAELMVETAKVLQSVTKADAEAPRKVFHPQPRSMVASVHKEGDTFVVVAPALERVLAGRDMSTLEGQWQLKRQLTRLGISKALEKAGVKPGDKVRCGGLEWEWQ